MPALPAPLRFLCTWEGTPVGEDGLERRGLLSELPWGWEGVSSGREAAYGLHLSIRPEALTSEGLVLRSSAQRQDL